VAVTLVLIALLGAVFLKGFSEAIGIAVVLVAVYLALNLVVVVAGVVELVTHPRLLSGWRLDLSQSYNSPFSMVGSALLLFPALALGLSGFETGVVVMPLIKGDPQDTPAKPTGRIRNAGTMLTAAVDSCWSVA